MHCEREGIVTNFVRELWAKDYSSLFTLSLLYYFGKIHKSIHPYSEVTHRFICLSRLSLRVKIFSGVSHHMFGHGNPSLRVCRFVTLAVCTNTECLSAASIGACETVVVCLGNKLTAII